MTRKIKTLNFWLKAFAIVLAIIIILLAAFYGIWCYITKDLTGEKYTPNKGSDIYNEVINENNIPEGAEPSFVPDPTDDPSENLGEDIPVDSESGELPESDEKIVQSSALDNLKANILSWKDSGKPAKADGVTNILLIGMDINSTSMKTNSRADAMMIVSINHNTKKITLASIMRDQYCYVERGSKSKFEKLHHANAYGGPSLQISMLEKYYKISIDNYAVVNFYSLPKVIDAIGGVTVSLTSNEVNYMNKAYGLNLQTGANHLNGATALTYMRIRYNTGGDTARVGRQQEVIKQVFKSLRKQSPTTLVSLILEIDEYIRTGYSSDQMLSLGTNALVNGWFDYEVVQLTLPDSSCSKSFTVSGGWYWKVDFPLAAQKLQMALYGTTNIQLDPNRKSWLS